MHDKSAMEAMDERHVKPQKTEPWLPKTLDVAAWSKVSADLRRERNRVMENLDNVCRTSTCRILKVQLELTHVRL